MFNSLSKFIITFSVLVLATWRTGSILAGEEGPKRIFRKIRIAVGVVYDKNDKAFWKQGSLGHLVGCIWCNTVWIGIALALLYHLFRDKVLKIALPLAISAGAIGWDKIVNGRVKK